MFHYAPTQILLPLDDEFAKKVGNLPSMQILREKIKESILNEKKS